MRKAKEAAATKLQSMVASAKERLETRAKRTLEVAEARLEAEYEEDNAKRTKQVDQIGSCTYISTALKRLLRSHTACKHASHESTLRTDTGQCSARQGVATHNHTKKVSL